MLIKFSKKFLFTILLTGILTIFNMAHALTEEQKQSYALGMTIGQSFKQQGINIESKSFMEGLQSIVDNAKSQLTEQQRQQAMMELQKQVQNDQKTEDGALAEKNKQAGEVYLKKHRQNKDVKITKSGIQYTITQQGDGKKPALSDKVIVHYQGNFINGDEFDSSYKRNEPATFGLTQVIPGWTEILQLMPVGSKYEVVIPSDLAYGLQAPPSIGPNRLLIFTIELLEIKK